MTPAQFRLGKKLREFVMMPEPEATRAYNAWLNSAGSAKRKAARQERVREFCSLIEAISKQLSPRDRAAITAAANAILAEAARKTPEQRTPKRTPKELKRVWLG